MKMITNKKYLLLFLLLNFTIISISAETQKDRIDLSGLWRFQLDPMEFGKTPGSELYLNKLNESIMLPGSTDESGKGIKNNNRYVDRLSRKFEYKGAAWYQREIVIPEDWSDKEIFLNLERCHWETTLYVDSKYIDIKESLSTPNTFKLSKLLTPGIHTLTLCINNDLKYPMDQWAHGTTEYTQTNWNGVIGDISLYTRPVTFLERVNVYPDIENKKASIKVNLSGTKSEGNLTFTLKDADGKILSTQTEKVIKGKADSVIENTFTFNKGMKLWDEFTPYLYTATVKLVTAEGEDSQTVSFGMRKLEQGLHHLILNNHPIHLRGVLDCCVFPLTGYPSVDVKDWKKIYKTVKEYGMNHVRFHSWCPPEAAFVAADELGLYLQVELPMWVKDMGKYPAREAFFEKEMVAILNEYGNHPSFLLYCNGNENEGDFSVLENIIDKGQKLDSRHLYSASTARTHTSKDQFYDSHVTSKGGITVYEGKPSTDWDKCKTSNIDVPVIAHEAGQRCMYPNFKEIKKYTGVLEARNFEVYRERLAKHGMLNQADDFFQATGQHTVLQYKEVIEALLRTSNSGGFQLLGLSDFPGQGCAFVGLLDAFWESKGLVEPAKFREGCAPTVLLARIPKRTFHIGEKLPVIMQLYNYSDKSLKTNKLQWELIDENGKSCDKGHVRIAKTTPYSTDTIAHFVVTLKGIANAQKLTLKTKLGEIKNEWTVWAYPKEKTTNPSNYIYATEWNSETRAMLRAGKNVLLVTTKHSGRKTRYASHFWNPIMFNWDPMIVGTLIKNNHPAFDLFPTSNYADWQWYDVLSYSKALELDDIRNITPLIQSIDSYEHNKKLGIAFEANVAKGKLFVLSVDVEKDIEKRLATKQLLTSIKHYVTSETFKPKDTVPLYQLDALFMTEKEQKNTMSNAVEQLLNK